MSDEHIRQLWSKVQRDRRAFQKLLETPEPDATQVDTVLAKACRTGILLNKTRHQDDPGTPGSWIGGKPTLPADIDWPWDDSDTVPLHFLAQIDLRYLPRLHEHPDMPNSGTLFFFCDPIFQQFLNHGRSGHKVVFVDDDLSDQSFRDMPRIPDVRGLPVSRTIGSAFDPKQDYKRWNFDYQLFEAFYWSNDLDHWSQRAILNANIETYETLEAQTDQRRSIGPYGEKSTFSPHHFFGSSGSLDPTDGWIRLLAIRTDRDIGIRLSGSHFAFWIAPEDLINRNFNDTEFWREC
ncbi:MAG: DUF1963 domain-containing protein [Pseudomonadota bacterium]